MMHGLTKFEPILLLSSLITGLLSHWSALSSNPHSSHIAGLGLFSPYLLLSLYRGLSLHLLAVLCSGPRTIVPPISAIARRLVGKADVMPPPPSVFDVVRPQASHSGAGYGGGGERGGERGRGVRGRTALGASSGEGLLGGEAEECEGWWTEPVRAGGVTDGELSALALVAQYLQASSDTSL